jgi:hypothetical protein
MDANLHARDKQAMLSLAAQQADEMRLEDFWAYLPDHRYIHTATRSLWPAASVDGHIKPWPMVGKKPIRPSSILDLHRAVQQMTWHPNFPGIIEGKLAYEGGWLERPGTRTFNLYLPPNVIEGNAKGAERWRDQLRCMYPNDADHIERWLAQRIQHPGVKINHALVLGGEQGIGKDSLLEPVKQGVGPWNFAEVGPQQMLGRFNPWVRSVILRISEGRDLGDIDRFAFYEHCKTYTVTPPDILRCDEKNIREHPVHNVMGVILTTNHKTSGIYLPADDRRHYVAWSDIRCEEFNENYWSSWWNWLTEEGGVGNVIAYLRELDLSSFNPKTPPPKTAAWYAIVAANIAPEDSELDSLIAEMNVPPVITLPLLVDAARRLRREEIAFDLADRTKRRVVPHKLERAGYSAVRNPNAKSGRWVVQGNEIVIYGHRDKTPRELIQAATGLCSGRERRNAYAAASDGD